MLSIIVATAQNNAIGKDNDLLWRIPGDLKRFKQITEGHTIIMGRKTFLSLPKVLTNRHHVILTRDRNFKLNDPNVEVVHSLQDVLEKHKTSNDEAFIIGGGEIYSAFLPHSKKLYLTKVYKDFDADTFFPDLDESDWTITYQSNLIEENNLSFKFINLYKKE